MTSACQIQLAERDDTIVVIVEGELDLTTSPLLEERLLVAEASGARQIIVDLEGVTFMDSSGLHVLVAHAGGDNANGRVLLTSGSEQVRRIFELVGMSHRLAFVSAS